MIRHIIPTPKEIQMKEGSCFVPFSVTTGYEPWKKFVNTLAESAAKIFDLDPCALPNDREGIVLSYDPDLKKDSYRITAEDSLVVSASTDGGMAHGIATALMMLERDENGLRCERAVIEDYADKPFRTLMLDLARKWHPLDKVLHMIDLAFFLKLSYVHLHLIDNQACRIPSARFPKLAHHDSYSYEEIATMREYAAARGVELIPEFDIPGHARQLVKHYPEVFANSLEDHGESGAILSETGERIQTDDIICAGSKVCFDAICKLFSELVSLFPESHYIHIGGDEAYIKVWDHCPCCREYMKEKGISDRYELYSEYVSRVASHVLSLGRTPIVWEGFPQKGACRIPKETVVIAWETHYHMPQDLLKEGFRIINGSWKPLYVVRNYLHWSQKEVYDWDPHSWYHWWDQSEAYLNPIHLEPRDDVLGAQLSLWEGTYDQEICPAMENAAALSERTWNVHRVKDYDLFHRMAAKSLDKLALLICDR
ncbi:MAG: family 20 glycosylhydrolase [Clostridia bacterium]|nr:family 20 glycosylhydrolase [Clostridia bacterium]